jgi:hypothetical protein
LSKSHESIDPRGLGDIREAIVEIEALIVSYEEFAERVTADGKIADAD